MPHPKQFLQKSKRGQQTTANLTLSAAKGCGSGMRQFFSSRASLLFVSGFLIAPLLAHASGGTSESVKLKFTKDPLKKVVRDYGALVGKPASVEEKLEDRAITMQGGKDLSRDEAIEFIRATLRNNYGIELVETESGVTATTVRVKDLPAPEGYYNATTGLEGEALKAQLQDITSGDHKTIGYAATRDVLAQMHEDPANTNNVITVYARKSVPKEDEDEWNREHVLPQSYGARGGENARCDLHNLFPSVNKVNAMRGNLIFDESDKRADTPKEAPLCSFDNDSWEPPDQVKGDLARAVFYMDVRYDGSDTAEDISLGNEPAPEDGRFAKLSTLLQWHQQDPVSDDERKRNNEVFSVQGNRNPFIDRPEFADQIYGLQVSPNPVGWREFMENADGLHGPLSVIENFDMGVLAAEDAVREWSKLSRDDKMMFCEFVHVVGQQEFCVEDKYSERVGKLLALERKTRPVVGLPEMRGGH